MTIHVHSVNGRSLRIRTIYAVLPIPDRSHDWSAVEDSSDLLFFNDGPVGQGATESAAIADLLDQLGERPPLAPFEPYAEQRGIDSRLGKHGWKPGMDA